MSRATAAMIKTRRGRASQMMGGERGALIMEVDDHGGGMHELELQVAGL